MTRFRPCIDLHDGQVKQIVGGSLKDSGAGPIENHVSEHSPTWFAKQYQRDHLTGGHVIKLGPGNDEAAREALAAWPNGLQIGGGISIDNASEWLDAGASHVIVTSWLFTDNELNIDRVRQLSAEVGADKLVIDLSCRRVTTSDDNESQISWKVATNRWQTITSTPITAETLETLGSYCDEFLIHAADVEGKQAGMDEELIQLLGDQCPRPCTYAGGARSLADLERVEQLSTGKIDLTIGSALDIFGGSLPYTDCVHWNEKTTS